MPRKRQRPYLGVTNDQLVAASTRVSAACHEANDLRAKLAKAEARREGLEAEYKDLVRQALKCPADDEALDMARRLGVHFGLIRETGG